MKYKISEWPPALLKKWLTLVSLGIGCLSIGVLMLMISNDVVLLTMSIILAILIALRCTFLFHSFSRQDYFVIEGVCIRTNWIPLQRRRTISLVTDDDDEYTLSMENKSVPKIGETYRAFLLDKSLSAGNMSVVRHRDIPTAFVIERILE